MPQERRLVTVLFADMVDSSSSMTAHDAEVVRSALAGTFGKVRDILIAHGGTVEKFIGDAVFAVFGVPTAHEDDAERAVRAALALRAAATLSADPMRFVLRIGVNSGEVVADVTGDIQGGQFLATGEPVIVAARLQQVALPGEILAGRLTADLTRRSVRYGDPRTVFGKGLGMIETLPVLGATSQGSRKPREGPFVGREAELALLGGFLARARASERAHIVTVTGDPGVGKSRLVEEFLRRSGGRAVRTACLPYGPAITYWPLQELIRADTGISATDDAATAEAKLRLAVSPSLDPDTPEVALVAEQLSALALSGRMVGSSVEDPRDLARALRRYLESRLRSSPAIIVIEDLHWAEEALLNILGDALGLISAPVVVIATARRDIWDRGIPWGTPRANVLTIDLDPLDRAGSLELAGALLGDPHDSRIASILERTEGNPLFLEEYVSALADKGIHDVPATLHGVIAARIDALSPSIRHALKEASVLGRDFWADALPTSNDEGGAWLEEASHRGLIERTTQVGPSGGPTYRFRHGLIRDVAYGSLSKSDRSRLHDHYSEWLTTVPAQRSGDYAEIALYHAERAFELAREVKLARSPELGLRAFRSLRRAVSRAVARADYPLTLELGRRALATADLVGADRAERAEVQALTAIARIRIEPSDEAVAELEEAIEAARLVAATPDLVYLLTWRAWIYATQDQILLAQALYAEAVEVAKRTGDADAIAYALWTSAEPLRMIGRLGEHRRTLEEALAHMRSSGAERWIPRALAQLSASALEMGDLEVAVGRAEEALTIAERTGRRVDRYLALDALSRALVTSHDPRARETAERTLVAATELGGIAALVGSTDVAAEAQELDGEGGAAESLIVDVLGRLDLDHSPTLRADIARLESLRARLALERGDLDAATEAAQIARRVSPRSDVAARARALIASASVAQANGQTKDAEDWAREARELLAPTDHTVLKLAAEGFDRIAAPR